MSLKLRLRLAGWLYDLARKVDPPTLDSGPRCPDCQIGPELPEGEDCPYCRDAREQQERDNALYDAGYGDAVFEMEMEADHDRR